MQVFHGRRPPRRLLLKKTTSSLSIDQYLLVFHRRIFLRLLLKSTASSFIGEDLLVFCRRRPRGLPSKETSWSWPSTEKKILAFYWRRPLGLLLNKTSWSFIEEDLWSSSGEDLQVFYRRQNFQVFYCGGPHGLLCRLSMIFWYSMKKVWSFLFHRTMKSPISQLLD